MRQLLVLGWLGVLGTATPAMSESWIIPPTDNGHDDRGCYLAGSTEVSATELPRTTATLSQGRSGLAATSVDSKALFGGGHSGVGRSDVVDIFDAETQTWSTASLSSPRSSLAATTVGTKAIFAGGWVSTGTDVDIYDARTDTWTTGNLSQNRMELAATSVGDKAFFAGGYATGGILNSDVVDIYDAQTSLWSTAALSQARPNPRATSVGSKAIFAGGYTAPGIDCLSYSCAIAYCCSFMMLAMLQLRAVHVCARLDRCRSSDLRRARRPRHELQRELEKT